jgi:hypothetical protein
MILLFQHPPPQYSMIRIVNDVAKMAVTCCDMLFAALSASSAPGTYLHAPRYLYGTCSCSFLGPVSTPVLRNGSYGKVDRTPTSIGVKSLLNTQNQALCVDMFGVKSLLNIFQHV